MFLTFIEFPTIVTMGLNFFNDKIFNKINIFKSKGALHSLEQIRLRYYLR